MANKKRKRTPRQKKPKKKGIRNWSAGTWFGIVSSVIAIVGVGTAIYLYTLSVSKREPIFITDPARTILIKSESIKDSAIRVTRTDGTVIRGDIISLRFYFWNNGKALIRNKHILEPISIFFRESGVEILDFKLLRVSRSNIVQPVLKRNAVSPRTALDLDFNILEEQDGFSVQLIYSGPPAAELFISGTIEGARQIAGNKTIGRNQYWRSYFERYTALLWIALAIGFVIANFLFFDWVGKHLKAIRENNSKRSDTGQKIRYYMATAIQSIPAAFVVFLVLSLVVMLLYGLVIKPFREVEDKAEELAILSVPAGLRTTPTLKSDHDD